MADTLKDFYTDKRNKIKTLEINAKSSLSKATRNLGNAQKKYDELVVEYADLEKDIKKKREALNTALMPSDIESLAEELRKLNLQLRKKRSEILALEQQLNGYQLDNDLAEAQLARAGSALTAVDTQVKAAEAREDQHTEWRQAITDGRLAELANQAQALLDEAAEGEEEGGNGGNGDAGGGDEENGDDENGDGDDEEAEGEEEASTEVGDTEESIEEEEKSPIQKAKARIENDIPALLRSRGRERGQRIEAYLSAHKVLLSDIETALDTHREGSEGAVGLSAKRWREYARAEEAFKDFVLQSASRYDQALSLIQTINASAELTEAEKDRIQDAALAEGDEALAKEKALDEARTAVTTKVVEVRLAIVQALIKDIDTDPEADATVQTKRSELETLHTALTAAESEFEDVRNGLDLWEAAVPDHIWANLVAYDNANTLLTGIKDGDPNALATAMENAERSLASALKKEDQGVRVNESVNDRITLLDAQLEYLRNAHHQRKLGAVRGDA